MKRCLKLFLPSPAKEDQQMFFQLLVLAKSYGYDSVML